MTVNWPSEVVDNKVPTLTDIMASGGDACKHASKLLTDSHSFSAKGDQLQFQEIYFTDNGAICLPAIATKADKSQYIIYSHAGPWSEEDLVRLLTWVSKVRTVPELAELKIDFILDDHSAAADEIIDHINTYGPEFLVGNVPPDPIISPYYFDSNGDSWYTYLGNAYYQYNYSKYNT